MWQDCNGSGTDIYVLAATPNAGGAFTVILWVQVVDDADLPALQTAFTTFAAS